MNEAKSGYPKDRLIGHVLAGVLIAAAGGTTRAVRAELAIDSPPATIGISANGHVTVGADAAGAILWDGTEHAIPGGRIATAANQDGSVVVGSLTSPPHAFRWTQAGGPQDLGALPGFTQTDALGVSADGSIVVGVATDPSGSTPWIWDAIDGMRSLGAIDGATQGSANAISRDGTVIVGRSGHYAFRWTAQDGMQNISPGLADDAWAEANATSADGSVIVGRRGSLGVGIRPRQFRWSASTGLSELPSADWGATSPGNARAIDADATHIYGSLFMSLQDASIGSASTGTIKLAGYLQAEGLDLADWHLWEVLAASDDGDVLVGFGEHRVGADLELAGWRITGLNSVGPIFVDGFDNGE